MRESCKKEMRVSFFFFFVCFAMCFGKQGPVSNVYSQQGHVISRGSLRGKRAAPEPSQRSMAEHSVFVQRRMSNLNEEYFVEEWIPILFCLLCVCMASLKLQMIVVCLEKIHLDLCILPHL